MPHAKPVNLARWAEDTGEAAAANITEPASGQKDTGWTNAQVPPSSYFNWWMWQIYQWIKYVNDLADQAITWTAAHVFQKGITVTQSTANTAAFTATGNGTGSGGDFVGGANAKGLTGAGRGNNPGVYGATDNTGGNASAGVAGVGPVSAAGWGVTGVGDIGVEGFGRTVAVRGTGGGANGIGVVGTGVGAGEGVKGTGLIGARGISSGTAGVSGEATSGATGVQGSSDSGIGVYGQSATGLGARFTGNATKAPLRLDPQAAPSTPGNGDMWFDTGDNTLKVRINGVTKTVTVT